MPHIEPFLRWAGGKSWLVKYMDTIIGNTAINNYHEPFLGGAAIFFSVEHPNVSYLSDINQELISTYIAIKETPDDVIEELRQYANNKEEYYRIRALEPEGAAESAARFIYLNQTSFNGLYRVNKNGKYNVPYGFRASWKYDSERIRQASRKLQNAHIACGDFTVNRDNIHAGDLVFLDPPYTVSHNNNGFIEYNRNLFSLADQRRLSQYIDHIKECDAYYILTNAAHQTIAEIFEKGDRRLELNRNSLIGGRNARRQEISEYIFTNIPEGV